MVQLTEQQAALEAELEAERRRVEDVRQRIETAKAALTAQNQEIARRVRDKERKEQELEEGQLAAKKLEHRVVKAEEEAKGQSAAIDFLSRKKLFIGFVFQTRNGAFRPCWRSTAGSPRTATCSAWPTPTTTSPPSTATSWDGASPSSRFVPKKGSIKILWLQSR